MFSVPSYLVAGMTQTWTAESGEEPYYVVKGGEPTAEQTSTEFGKQPPRQHPRERQMEIK